MEDAVRDRMNRIRLSAKADGEYVRMLEEIRVLERRYNEVLAALSPEMQDVICDFGSQCEEMSERMLELACACMHLPE